MSSTNAAIELQTAGEHRLLLRADGSAFCPATRTLFAADMHLGKGAAFRAQGQAVPRGSSAATLARLATAIRDTQAQRLVVLGDFWHSPQGRSAALLQQLQDWAAQQTQTELLLVAGNHDRGSAPPPGFSERPEPWALPGTPLQAWHHPPDAPEAYALAGHWHPAFTLRGAGRLRAFLATPNRLVLPAFGDFTGALDLARERPPHSRIWLCGDDAIWPLPTP